MSERVVFWPTFRLWSVIALTALVVLAASWVAWGYRRNSNFRNDLKILLFNVSEWRHDHNALLVGDSRVASMSCAGNFSGWHILNLGVAGSRADEWRSFLKTRAKIGHFDAAILWVGINDVIHINRTANSISKDMLSLLESLESVSQRIALINPTDAIIGHHADMSEHVDQELRELSNLIQSRIDPRRVSILIPFASEKNADRNALYADSIHLNARGYGILCSELYRWLANSARSPLKHLPESGRSIDWRAQLP